MLSRQKIAPRGRTVSFVVLGVDMKSRGTPFLNALEPGSLVRIIYHGATEDTEKRHRRRAVGVNPPVALPAEEPTDVTGRLTPTARHLLSVKTPYTRG